MIKLLAIDVDGTLLDTRGRVPPAHADALSAAAAHGIEVALATGRSAHFMHRLAELLPVPVTLILNNGAVVKTADGRTAMRRLLKRETALEVLSATREYETSVAVVFDRDPYGQAEPPVWFEHMDWTHPQRRGYYEKHRAFIARKSPLADAIVEDPIEVMFTGHVEPMRTIASHLRALPVAGRVSIAVTEYEHRDFSLVDVHGPGCSKGDTLASWAATLGLSHDEVMAVGDNLNDLEMLRFAGTAVVMGNAVDAVRSQGFHVTGTNDEGGLASAIERFALAPLAAREPPGSRPVRSRDFNP
jgi:Cof subfamily protein (haloacid dehalogenase superfamily)